MKSVRPSRFLSAILLLVSIFLPALCEGTISCTIADDRFIGPGEAVVYVKADGESIYAVRGEDGKALHIDRTTGECTVYVSEEALERGSIILNVTLGHSDGETYTVELPVKKVSDECLPELFILFPDRTVYEGETLPLRYVLVNRGETELTDVTLSSEDGTAEHIEKLNPGENLSFTLYRTMNRDEQFGITAVMHSAFTGKEETRALTGITPVFAKENIVLSAVYDTSVPAGKSARVTLNIENKGNCALSDCGLMSGGSFCMSELPCIIQPGDFITLSLTTPILTENAIVTYELTGVAGNGETRVFTSDEMEIRVVPAADDADVRKTDSPEETGNTVKRDIVMGIVRMDALDKVLIAAAGAVCITLLVILAAGYKKKQDESDK